jgi:hypothetical protein
MIYAALPQPVVSKQVIRKSTMIMPYIVQCRTKSKPGVDWAIQNLVPFTYMAKKLLNLKFRQIPGEANKN